MGRYKTCWHCLQEGHRKRDCKEFKLAAFGKYVPPCEENVNDPTTTTTATAATTTTDDVKSATAVVVEETAFFLPSRSPSSSSSTTGNASSSTTGNAEDENVDMEEGTLAATAVEKQKEAGTAGDDIEKTSCDFTPPTKQKEAMSDSTSPPPPLLASEGINLRQPSVEENRSDTPEQQVMKDITAAILKDAEPINTDSVNLLASPIVLGNQVFGLVILGAMLYGAMIRDGMERVESGGADTVHVVVNRTEVSGQESYGADVDGEDDAVEDIVSAEEASIKVAHNSLARRKSGNGVSECSTNKSGRKNNLSPKATRQNTRIPIPKAKSPKTPESAIPRPKSHKSPAIAVAIVTPKKTVTMRQRPNSSPTHYKTGVATTANKSYPSYITKPTTTVDDKGSPKQLTHEESTMKKKIRDAHREAAHFLPTYSTKSPENRNLETKSKIPTGSRMMTAISKRISPNIPATTHKEKTNLKLKNQTVSMRKTSTTMTGSKPKLKESTVGSQRWR